MIEKLNRNKGGWWKRENMIECMQGFRGSIGMWVRRGEFMIYRECLIGGVIRRGLMINHVIISQDISTNQTD